jgi:hypothetical protein
MPGCAQHRDFLVISTLNDFYTVTVPRLAAFIHCEASYIVLVAYFVRNNLDAYQTYAAIRSAKITAQELMEERKDLMLWGT